MKKLNELFRISALAFAISTTTAAMANGESQVQGSAVKVVDLKVAEVDEAPRAEVPERMSELFSSLADVYQAFNQSYSELDTAQHEALRMDDWTGYSQQLFLKSELSKEQQAALLKKKDELAALLNGAMGQWKTDAEKTLSNAYHDVINEATELDKLEKQLAQINEASKGKVLTQDQAVALMKLNSDKESLYHQVKTKVMRAKIHQAQLGEVGHYYTSVEYFKNKADTEAHQLGNHAKVFHELSQTAAELGQYESTRSIQSFLDTNLPLMTSMDLSDSAPDFEPMPNMERQAKQIEVTMKDTTDGESFVEALRGMSSTVDAIDRRHAKQEG